ncbi:hypothetical protein HY383_03260 [Candidatus Daviesbacteria bacterium]|nr:hypothetical protein [Candidatus Daviesbacteria bacterium]
MEKFNGRPSISEIFDALTSEETTPDWDTQILREADGRYVERIRDVLNIGLPLGEARIALRGLEER